jgi:hypothetical protein
MSREPYDPNESSAQSLRNIDETLERIAKYMRPDLGPVLAKDRAETLERLKRELRHSRYRNIVFDGMDTVYTAVIPVARVEQALEKAFDLPWKSVTLDVLAAQGEGPREDRNT